MKAVLLAACLGAPDPQGLGHLSLGPASPTEVTVEDARGEVVATAHVRGDAAALVHVPPGSYVVRGAGASQALEIEAGETVTADLPGQVEVESAPEGPSEAHLPATPPRPSPAADPVEADPAWRAPLIRATSASNRSACSA